MLSLLLNSEEVYFREAAKAHGLVPTHQGDTAHASRGTGLGGPGSCHRHLRTVPERLTSCSLWPCAATGDCSAQALALKLDHTLRLRLLRESSKEKKLCSA